MKSEEEGGGRDGGRDGVGRDNVKLEREKNLGSCSRKEEEPLGYS